MDTPSPAVAPQGTAAAAAVDPSPTPNSQVAKPPGWWGTRYTFTLLTFFGFFNAYALRLNLSVALVAMVSHGSNSSVADNATGECADPAATRDATYNSEDDTVTFDWDSQLQGIILGAFYYGFCLTQLPGGILAERYSGKWIFGLGLLGSAVLTLFYPLAAETHVVALILLRSLQGLCEGLVIPAFYALAADWFPEQEKSFLISLVWNGTNLGAICVLPLSGYLADQVSWQSIFYVTGGFGVAWAACYLALVHKTPQEHPRISKLELEYIRSNVIKSNVKKTRFLPPLRSVLRSPAVWAVMVAHSGSCWGFLTLMSSTPVYLSEIQQFSLQENGVLSAIPYMAMLVLGTVFGAASDRLVGSGRVTPSRARKLFNSIGMYGPGLALVWLAFVGCDRVEAIVALTLAVGLNAGTFAGFQVNYNDLAPNYSGTLYAVGNTMAQAWGFVSPFITGAITNGNQTISAWRIVFLLGAVIFCFTNTIFVVFGSASVQDFNDTAAGDSKKRAEAAETQA